MADSQGNNSARLRRNISKIAFRNKERVMRSIGRAEETKDEILDHYVMLINKQQIQMQKLQRDMKQYLQSLKAMSISQKAFYNSLYEVYDEDWRNEVLYEDIFARFQSEVLELLQNHLSEYQKCKGCVEKRGRKLVDYDAAKRTLHVIESSKKPDPARLEKSKENLRQTREIYEELNNFLHQQLPTLYDSRLSVCVNIFSSICESESMFSSEVAELRTKLNTVLLNLKSAFDSGEYHIQRMQTPLDNGRTSGSPRSRTAPPVKVPRGAMELEVNVHNSDTVPAPRTPSENDVVPPSTDPSTHEYVNLQVGESVKPVSEEEELASGDSQSNNKKSKRPASMFLPASAGKMSVHKEVKGGTKDDGSGSVDKGKEKDPNSEEKTSKGLFGFLGLRRSRSSKNINSASLSVASKEKATSEEASSKDRADDAKLEKGKQGDDRENGQSSNIPVVGAVATASAAVAVSSVDTNTDKGEANRPEERTGKEIGPSTTKVKPSNDESEINKVINEEVKDTEKVEHAQIQRKVEPREEVEDVFLRMPASDDAPSGIDDSTEDGETKITQVSHADSESPEHMPANDQPIPNDSVRSQFEEQEFSPFADTEYGESVEPISGAKPTDDSLAFGEAIGAADAGFEDAFGDSFTAPTQLQVDDFSKEPFQSFSETVDVVLDGDESVFDPNSPISPADFKAIPDNTGETRMQPRPNISTSDVSISSHVDSLDDDEPSSLTNSLPDKLPELVDPASLEKQPEHEISTDIENVVANIEYASANVIADPCHTGNESRSGVYQGGSKRSVDDSPDSDFLNVAPHNKMTDTAASVVDINGVSKMGNNGDDLQESVSPVAAVFSTTDAGILPSPEVISSAHIEDQPTRHLDIGDRLEIKTNTQEDYKHFASAIQPASNSSGNFYNDAVEGPTISNNDDNPKAHNDQDDYYEEVPDCYSNNEAIDNVGLYENVSSDDVRNSTSDIAAAGNKSATATSQLPPPNNTHHDIESNSEIPPIYEEPPRDDDPIHELSSSSSNNHPKLPQNYLFSVQALYKYCSTDDDELSFNKGDIIHIIVHPDPEEQDEGWQMGVRQIDWEENGENASMGVFPENFTKEVEL